MSHNNHVSAKAEVKQQKIFSAQHDSSTKPNGVCMQEKTRYMRCIRSDMHTSLSLSHLCQCEGSWLFLVHALSTRWQ